MGLFTGIQEIKPKRQVDIYTGVTPGNTVAKKLYESVGFVSTGLIELNMEEMRLKQ